MCQEWLHIQSSVTDLPPEASELISAAVGQTQLLLRSKFSQFRDLINKCEKSLAGETDKPVTCLDLEGFWDVVFMQVQELVIPTFT
jgi:disks large-associated protein 5